MRGCLRSGVPMSKPAPPSPTPARPVLIAGMYHSGTSMLAKCLHEQGVRMWSDEWGQVSDEKQEGREFCECKRLWDINQREQERGLVKLRADGMGYNYVPSLEMRQDLVGYRKAREAEGVAWGAKEPRIATYIDAYTGTFRGAKLILCLRNQGRVAESRLTRGHGTTPIVTLVTSLFTAARCLTRLNEAEGVDTFLWVYERTEAEHCRQQAALREFLGMPEFDYMGQFKRER